MKNFIKNNYHKHALIGMVIGNYVAVGLHYFNHTDLIINLIVGAFIGLLGGITWEGEQTFRYQYVKFDKLDVAWSAIGSLLGSLIITLIF